MAAGAVAAATLGALYAATAAPDLTWWDAPELATAAQTLGIPHPPGTPLWVLMGRVTAVLASSLGPVRAVTLLAVLSAAAAGGVGAVLLARWIPAGRAVVAAVSAGALAVPWQNATEVEVYAVAHLHALLLLLVGARAGNAPSSAGRARWRALLVYGAGAAIPLHLSALVALPAALVLAWPGGGTRAGRGAWWRPQELGWLAALALLGASSVLVLPVRAAQHPLLNSGTPDTLAALMAVLGRSQYDVAGLWPRQAPLWLQLGNLLQWADWQVAWGWWPHPTPSWGRTPVTVAWALAAAWGARALAQRNRRGAMALGTLLVSGSVGVVLWLNLKAGPTFGAGVLPPGALHEARERDYFFTLAFWCWGVLAAGGVLDAVGQLTRRIPFRAGRLAGQGVALGLALLPVWANAAAMDRGRDPVASWPRVAALSLLDAVPSDGVLLAAGDHDSFPLWFLQQVEERRPDVAVVTWSLLPARWYRGELHRQRLLPASLVEAATPAAAVKGVLAEAERLRRPVRVSVWMSRHERTLAVPGTGWRWEGLVWAPVDTVPPGRPVADARRLREGAARLPRVALAPLPVGADPVARAWHGYWRCLAMAAGAVTGGHALVAPCAEAYP
ncbi:MAG: DUF2723 domain-containing protein [Gemmatimonadetes bacterium]|nr:DUF2723 domain-containing protein [Gemmatimonadota bacterium]